MNLLDVGALVVAGAFVAWQLDAVGPWTNGAQPVSAAPQVEGKLTVLSDKALPDHGDARADFREFSQGPSYFGAFALSRDGGPAFTYGYNTLEAARLDVLAYCAKKHSQDCAIYAIMEPAEALPEMPMPLSAEATEAYIEYQGLGGHRAFAIADNGAYGLTWDWDSERGARAEALSICAGYAADEEAYDPAITQCRVILSH